MEHMDFWANVIAVVLPSAVAAIIAFLLKRRALFWGAFIGATVGLLLGSLESAIYDDPFDKLIARTQLALEGTIPGSVVGIAIGCCYARRTKSAIPKDSTPAANAP